MSPPPTPPTARTPAARSVAMRRAFERRALQVGLAISVVLHVLLIGVFGGMLERRPSAEEPAPGQTLVEPPDGMRAIAVRPVEPTESSPDAAPRVDAPPPPRPADRPARTPQVVLVPEADATPADETTVADRLAPRVVDPRLWRPMVVMPRAPTLEDVQARVAAAVELLSDSALAETERQIRARDWTVEDAEGGRWGISPGKLHLGKLTLPLPIVFPSDPAMAARESEWLDIQAQLDRALLLESFEARVKAIRERRDRERAERRSTDGDSGG